MAWIVRLVTITADGEDQSVDVMTINRPDDLRDIANVGLTLAEGKLLLAGLQQQIVAAQAESHPHRRPDCRSCGAACHVKDYRDCRKFGGSGGNGRLRVGIVCGLESLSKAGAERAVVDSAANLQQQIGTPP